MTVVRGPLDRLQLLRGCTMEVSRHPFYVFYLDEHASLMSFV